MISYQQIFDLQNNDQVGGVTQFNGNDLNSINNLEQLRKGENFEVFCWTQLQMIQIGPPRM